MTAARFAGGDLAYLRDEQYRDANRLDRELHEEEASVFGAEVGFGLRRERFAEVGWVQYEDELRYTDPGDVLAYSCSSPPAEDATPAQRAALAAAIAARFASGDGVMRITKDAGAFVCCDPAARCDARVRRAR